MEAPKLNMSFDVCGDVFYISAIQEPAWSATDTDGIVRRYSAIDGKLLSVTILDFSTRWRKGARALSAMIASDFGVNPTDPRTNIDLLYCYIEQMIRAQNKHGYYDCKQMFCHVTGGFQT